MVHIWWVLVFVFISPTVSSGDRGKGLYDDLASYLLNSTWYSTTAMPICEVGKSLLVKQEMVLYQLFDLDEPTQQLMINVWVETIWKDCRLTWNPSEFNNVTEISLPSSSIWYPQLIFYQSLHGNFEEGLFVYSQSRARIRNDGMVQLGCQALLKTFCRVNLKRFPFDRQTCNVTFTSWINDNNTLHLVSKNDPNSAEKLADHSFKDASNGEWEVVGFPSFNDIKFRKVGIEENLEVPYSEVTFQLQLKRKFLFYQVYMVFPCMLLSWIGTLVFIMPLESGEKISFCTTIFLSLIVFLLLVAENIPRSGNDVPVLGIYFTWSVITVAISILMTVLVLNVGLKIKEIVMPAWLSRCVRGPLTKIVCFKPAHHGGQQKWLSFKLKRGPKKLVIKNEEMQSPNTQFVQNAQTTDDVSTLHDWRLLAIFLDRIFLIIYLFMNITSTIYVIINTINSE